MKITQHKTSELFPYINNAREHSESQVTQIALSIREFGFTNPLLIDDDGGIIAGHGRLMAAKKLEMDEVPCIVLSGLSEAKKKALILADNKLALNATWDEELLKLELESLAEMDVDIGLTGFSSDELDDLLDEFNQEELPDNIDDVPEVETPVSELGDIWLLGEHRLMCGDSTDEEQVVRLLDGQKADMVFTDPPYGISIVNKNGNVGGSKPFGKNKNTKKIKVNNYLEIANDKSIDVAVAAIGVIKKLNVKTQIIWGGNYYAQHLEHKSGWIAWDKNTGDSTFSDGELAWTNLDSKLRIFKHTWSGLYKESEHGQARVHPTQKPVALAQWCFNEFGKEGENVLDLFGGSGSTLIACEQSNRQCYMMELDTGYMDVIINRWQNLTKQQAIHAQSGMTYEERQLQLGGD